MSKSNFDYIKPDFFFSKIYIFNVINVAKEHFYPNYYKIGAKTNGKS